MRSHFKAKGKLSSWIHTKFTLRNQLVNFVSKEDLNVTLVIEGCLHLRLSLLSPALICLKNVFPLDKRRTFSAFSRVSAHSLPNIDLLTRVILVGRTGGVCVMENQNDYMEDSHYVNRCTLSIYFISIDMRIQLGL